jgi:hypothetical protein
LLLSCSSAPEKSGSGSTSDPISYQDDIVPLVANNCALTACHSSKESNLNFFVTYDGDQIYTELMKTSPTCKSWKFVVPGKPDESMVVLKIEGNQSKLPNDCAIARRSEMPPPADAPNDSLLPKADRALFRRWVAEGAKKD